MDCKFLKGNYGSLYKRYKNNARSRNKSFNLSEEKFFKTVTSNCFWCGSAPYQKLGKIKYMGVDRIDSSIGYLNDNVLPCCKKCNYAKRDMSFEEFDNWVKSIVEHHNFLTSIKENYNEDLYRVKSGRRFEEVQMKLEEYAQTSALEPKPLKVLSKNQSEALEKCALYHF